MSRVECIVDEGHEVVLMEPRPFRPFKSSEEYLIAMKEDLAEWLHRLYYPQLEIDAENFMDVLEDGVVLCKHANNVRRTAVAYKEKWEQQGRRRSRKFSTHMDIPDRDVLYRAEVKPKSFVARDNVHNFITWCRLLGIYECLLFETDDLVLRKNEKSVILCLLEVARRGAHFGMPAPMLVQFEKEIDREIAKEATNGADSASSNNGDDDDDDDEEDDAAGSVEYGPHAQIVTNDLRSLDEMVRDLVEICSCPTQFPMIRISEGKYRIGDTKMLIFVRVLRNHVMVRVGGGWDTLSHYLEKHDPCRCRSGHRGTVASKLSVTHGARGNAPQMAVSYERATSPSNSRRSSNASNGTLPSRKNSMTGVTSPVYSSPHSPFDSPGRATHRQRSTSPSVRTPSRARNQSPGKSSPVMQRRYGFQRWPAATPTQLSPDATAAAQGNLDSLESYDSGISFDRRSASKRQQSSGSGGGSARANDSNSSDSSSEISDDGYRTNAHNDERPDSSCTQASSSAESGVSSASSHRSAKEHKTQQPTKIPALGGHRGAKLATPEASPVSRPGSRPASRPASRANSRRSSINSDTTSPAPFNRQTFGRHSLRLRAADPPQRPALNVPAKVDTGLSTWSGRNRRERPALSADLFSPTNKTPASGHRSRSVTYRGSGSSSRATSTSPSRNSRRSYNNASSIPSSPVHHYPSNFNWKAQQHQRAQQQPPQQRAAAATAVVADASPLKSMLKDLENDSEASILKKMEEIVNQYKARVEGILAAEGRTLEDGWDKPTNQVPNGVELNGGREAAAAAATSRATNRRRSLDAGSQIPIRVTPRKDTAGASPSKIPMPLFYRSKEACL